MLLLSTDVRHSSVSMWSALQGRILLPGAAMFEMMRAAAACLSDGAAGERLRIYVALLVQRTTRLS
jgi:hypothetical protein